MKCDESPEEPTAAPSFESFLQLSCFISQDVKYLFTGLKTRLEEKLTKQSPILGRDALYTKTSRINRLPSYLCIQLVRFFYKEKEKVSAKVLKDVKFPLMLDVFELCTSELQQKLLPAREAFRIQEEDENKERKSKKQQELSQGNNGAQPATKDATKEEDVVKYAPFSFENDPGSNNSGFYDLHAVLTHKGRSANSGHYVGWAKDQKTNAWYMYDDDTVTKVSEEEILKLSGGGDWHTAYVLFYGPRKLQESYANKRANVEEVVNSQMQTSNGQVQVDGAAAQSNGKH
jgi:ubiquitin carboxyl-terminal hydrolase 14